MHNRDIEWIKNDLGFEPPRVLGWKIAVKLWYPTSHVIVKGENLPDMELEFADSFIKKGIWMSISGMVVGIGPLAFKDKAFMGERLCEIGDYIQFKTQDSFPFLYGPNPDANKKIPMRLINDINVGILLEDPSHAVRD